MSPPSSTELDDDDGGDCLSLPGARFFYGVPIVNGDCYNGSMKPIKSVFLLVFAFLLTLMSTEAVAQTESLDEIRQGYGGPKVIQMVTPDDEQFDEIADEIYRPLSICPHNFDCTKPNGPLKVNDEMKPATDQPIRPKYIEAFATDPADFWARIGRPLIEEGGCIVLPGETE